MAKGLQIVLDCPEAVAETVRRVAAEFKRLREAGPADSEKLRVAAAALKQSREYGPSGADARWQLALLITAELVGRVSDSQGNLY